MLWHHYEVQIVFLLSVSLQKEESLEKFYRVAPRFMMDEARMEHLIQTKSYETLLEAHSLGRTRGVIKNNKIHRR